MKKFLQSILGLTICNAWAVEQAFDWSSVLSVPFGPDQTEGNQILHFKSLNKSYRENEDACLFVEKYFQYVFLLYSFYLNLKLYSLQ